MTLAEAGEIFAYWLDHPPAHLMVQTIARLLGWSPRPAERAVPDPPSRGGGRGPERAPSIEDLAAAPPPGLAVIRGAGLGLPAPLDRDALRERNRARALDQARRHRAARDPL